MAATSTVAHPISILREYATALEAAVTVCLGDPKPGAVHRLRTMTRRIEGQLTLLDLLSQTYTHREASARVRRIVRKLRRAAGQVRDGDVHLALLDEVMSSIRSPGTRDDAARLRKSLSERRNDTERQLLKRLRRTGGDLGEALEDLLKTLDQPNPMALNSTELTTRVRKWFAKNSINGSSNLDDEDHLHAIRKSAKLARYMAENAPPAAKTARRLATSFESLQQSGGRWHDWLLLAAFARERLGRSSPLAASFERRSQAALRGYLRQLNTVAA